MPYEFSVWHEVFYQDGNNIPRTVTIDLGAPMSWVAKSTLSTAWFGVREPSSGYGVAADIIDIDGASTPVVYAFGSSHPNDPNTHVSIAHPGMIGQATARRVTFRVRGTTFDSAAVAVNHLLVR
ncbi:hypothetical protein ACFQS1_37550 [Paractinoplanes rhizophilus]|jgi:hypothetical protein|uniref:Uncharacterized protein n=1 Tax=Paractinoplanes rhizophilus TaxID=1416877 RepID=A0ABW2I4H6_9ACTN|nr:hypothetical protein [Actinoplanes sp.]